MVLLVLGILVLFVPELLPTLTIPGAGQMSPMNP
jgi:hypothetical protein